MRVCLLGVVSRVHRNPPAAHTESYIGHEDGIRSPAKSEDYAHSNGSCACGSPRSQTPTHSGSLQQGGKKRRGRPPRGPCLPYSLLPERALRPISACAGQAPPHWMPASAKDRSRITIFVTKNNNKFQPEADSTHLKNNK
ncbi:hypothetical protein NDU88_001708 [Pleurodeles waltl]|uniref:Uncharacterized protein n=1 Tax=Pleurodeles waltl TaxID=8319 RepID=A0AAV7Q3W3_PLEWA|nr:hypothetical protein NDU88_001708 [Pleurodeles waltl]